MRTMQLLIYGVLDHLVNVEDYNNQGVAEELDLGGQSGSVRIEAPDSGKYLDLAIEHTDHGWVIFPVAVNGPGLGYWSVQFTVRPVRSIEGVVVVTAPAGSTFALQSQ